MRRPGCLLHLAAGVPTMWSCWETAGTRQMLWRSEGQSERGEWREWEMGRAMWVWWEKVIVEAHSSSPPTHSPFSKFIFTFHAGSGDLMLVVLSFMTALFLEWAIISQHNLYATKSLDLNYDLAKSERYSGVFNFLHTPMVLCYRPVWQRTALE